MIGLIPQNPKLTVDRSAKGAALRYCVDAKTEQVLQRQRLVVIAGSGLMVYWTWKLDGSWLLKSLITAGAAGTIYTQMSAYATVRKASVL